MQQSAVIVITNYTGRVTDSSVPPTDRHWHPKTYFEGDEAERGGQDGGGMNGASGRKIDGHGTRSDVREQEQGKRQKEGQR